jgi:hypothetical protein
MPSRDFRPRPSPAGTVAVVASATPKYDEPGEDARGRRERKQEGENQVEPRKARSLRIGRRCEGRRCGCRERGLRRVDGTMEQSRGHERLEIGARGKRESKPDDERVKHDTQLQNLLFAKQRPSSMGKEV